MEFEIIDCSAPDDITLERVAKFLNNLRARVGALEQWAWAHPSLDAYWEPEGAE